jgi:hypothetical protein
MKGVCQKPEGEICSLKHKKWEVTGELADVNNTID